MQSSEIFPSSYTSYAPQPAPGPPPGPPGPPPPSMPVREPRFIFTPEELSRLNDMNYLNPLDYTRQHPGMIQDRINQLNYDIKQMGREVGGLRRRRNQTPWDTTSIEAMEDQNNLMKKYRSVLKDYLKTTYK